MIDSRNINVIRSNVRDMKAETGANTSAVLELETLVGATPLPTGQSTITGAIKYLDEKPSGGSYEEKVVYTGTTTGDQEAITDIASVEELDTYGAFSFVWGHSTGYKILTSQTYPVSLIKMAVDADGYKIEKNTTANEYISTSYKGVITTDPASGICLKFTAPSGYQLQKIIAIKY